MPSNLTLPPNWRAELTGWLADNPKTMPDSLRQLHQEFLDRFPRNKIAQMSLEEYALGHKDYKDSFCYWLEWRLKELGSVRGGSSAKWGVWWDAGDNKWRANKYFGDAESAIQITRTNLDKLLTAAAENRFDELDKIGDQLGTNRNSLRAKPLYLYFPDNFLPINNPSHTTAFSRAFGLTPRSGLHAGNRQLLTHLRSLPEFAGFDTLQMMRFLYHLFGTHLLASEFANNAFRERLQQFVTFANSELYAVEERDYKTQIVETLASALTDERLASTDVAAILHSAWKRASKQIDNLTHWSTRADFGDYLQSEEGKASCGTLLHELFDEQVDLAERVNHFKLEINATYKRIFAHSKYPKSLSLSVISILLAARNPDNYMFYRGTAIGRACSEWNMAQPTGNAGSFYVGVMANASAIKVELDKMLPDTTDYIDVHSLLWFNLKFDENYKSRLDELRRNDIGSFEMALDETESDAFEIDEQVPEVPDIPPLLRPMWDAVIHSHNMILHGPPGTGKTYLVNHFTTYYLLWHNVAPRRADEYWQAVIENDKPTLARLRHEVADQRAFITFHQSYAYEEFVEGLRPVVDSNGTGQLGFKIEPGIFQLFCQRAEAAWQANPANPRRYVLVIDEINRGNIAKIFGELITLIEDDKRLGESNEIRVTLPYSGSFFAVPPNLVLLGTMNTADRSIALLDIALRRRFTFIEQMPDPNQLGIVDGLSLSRVLELLNQQLCRLIDRDHQIGRSYLMDINSLAELEFVWYQRIIPLLQEYFYNDTSRLRDVLTNAFVRSQESSAGSKLDWSTETMEREYMPIQRLTGDQFRQALLHFLNAQPYL
jgi:hypothetical protein